MKNFSKLLLSGFAIALLLLSQAYGQSPESFKYQAVVRDANYAPIAGQKVSIRISILEGSTTGNTVYQESHEPTTSAIGLISLNIGEGNILSGIFANLRWDLYEYYIRIEVDQYGGSNYTWLGTSKLLSVPYALYAKKAGSVDNVDDADADPTNELQTLSINGLELSISDGNTVLLPLDTLDLVAGNGIAIKNDTIINLKPSLWDLNKVTVFVDTNRVAIGISDTTRYVPEERFFVNGNIRMADDSSLFGLGSIVGFRGLSISSNPVRDDDIVISDNGQVTFEQEVGINQTFSFVDLNVRNQVGNSTIFQVEDTSGKDVFEIGRTGNVGINRITSNVTLQVRNRDTASNFVNNIIANFERANGDNIFQIQDDGDVVVTGDFSVNSGSKNFILDHPLDPANKILAHNAVESPDHVTYYHGTIQLDANGNATVALPSYFEALNTDVHYQLTCIGGFAQVYISSEVQNNQFSIAGGKPGMKVSWQLSATRNDPWAKDHPYQAEKLKDELQRGKYYYPEGYGKGRDYKIGSIEVNEKDQ
ncbi:MAG: hypothetical protein MRZ79_20700 [Bacteroidia bacterium]|nr:hypothetical protein [Bacteroidia bacterium]